MVLTTEGFLEVANNDYNKVAITTSKFPSFLKMANVTPIFKKRSINKEESFRPVSILPVLSKILEKLMSKQLSTFFANNLSKFQMWVQKGL